MKKNLSCTIFCTISRHIKKGGGGEGPAREQAERQGVTFGLRFARARTKGTAAKARPFTMLGGRSLLEFTTIGDDIPRLDVTDGFEEYEGGFDPDEEAYAYSLGFLAIPGVAMAALSFLVPFFFFLFRVLCCSWRRGCWPTAKHKSKSIMSSQFTTLILCLMVFAGSAIIYVYGAEATAAVDDFCDSLVRNTRIVIADFVRVSDGLVASSIKLGTEDSISVVVDLTADAVKLQKDVDDFQGNLKDIFEIVDLAFLIAAGVFLFVGLVTLISVGCKWRSVVIIITLSMPLIGMISWVSVGAAFPMTALFADSCNEMLVYQATPDNSTITDYIPCPDRNTSAEALESAYENLNDFALEINKEVKKANDATQAALNACLGVSNAVCDQVRSSAVTVDEMCVPYVNCTANPLASVCVAKPDRLTIYAKSVCPYPSAENKIRLADFTETYSVLACANDDVVGCRNAGRPITRADFLKMQDLAEGAVDLMAILPDTESLITCKFVERTLKDLTENYCADCVDALDMLWIGFALVGAGFFVSWFVLITSQAHMGKGGEVEGQAFGLEMVPPK